MSDANPFQQPIQHPTAEAYKTPESGLSGPPSIPTSLMVIGIIGLIMGALGILGVCMMGGGLAMSEAAVGFMPDEESRQAFRKALDLQFIPQVVQLTISLIVSPLLLAGSIGCLTRKPWSKGLLKIAILGSIFAYVVNLGIAAWLTIFHWDTINAPNAAQPGGEMITIASQAVGFGIILVSLGFFVWALIAMNGKRISEFYDYLSGASR